MLRGYRIFEILLLGMLLICVPTMNAQVKSQTPGYSLRIDYHFGNINPWLFFETPIANSVGFLSVFQMSNQGFAEVDLGPCFHFNNLQVITQVGFEVVESSDKGAELGHVIPQFFILYTDKNVLFESWNLFFQKAADSQSSSIYLREHITFRIYKKLYFGPHFETTLIDKAKPANYFGPHLDADIGIGLVSFFYARNSDLDDNLFRMTFAKCL
jgi:hypothetical protein